MQTQEKIVITVQSTVDAPIDKVWEYWIKPEHIIKWNNASDDWHTPRAENDLRAGGKFVCRMESRDGSMGFDFEGIYDAVEEHRYIEYTLGDGRKVKINFTDNGDNSKIVESFEAEDTNPIEMQRDGWQAIMNNFKKYAEEN